MTSILFCRFIAILPGLCRSNSSTFDLRREASADGKGCDVASEGVNALILHGSIGIGLLQCSSLRSVDDNVEIGRRSGVEEATELLTP